MIERVHAFLRAADERVCDELRAARHGTALVTEELPLVWALNALRVEDAGAGALELEREAERLQGHLGHRKLVVYDERAGTALAPDLAARGWRVYRLLVMARRRPSEKAVPADLAAEASRPVAAEALAAFRREQRFGWQDEAVEQLAAMDDRYTRALGARDFVAPARAPAAVCRLYGDGRTAQVDEVGTLAAQRGRGLASAVVLAACDAAEAAGTDLAFLLTDAGDWPQALYRRLGFEAIGSVHEFLKLPTVTARP